MVTEEVAATSVVAGTSVAARVVAVKARTNAAIAAVKCMVVEVQKANRWGFGNEGGLLGPWNE